MMVAALEVDFGNGMVGAHGAEDLRNIFATNVADVRIKRRRLEIRRGASFL